LGIFCHIKGPNFGQFSQELAVEYWRFFSYELGSDGFGSPGSLIGKPGFHFLPYGVRTPDSIMSTGSRDWYGSNVGSSAYGAGWKLPDKLRIVKPLEGSLTLHNWWAASSFCSENLYVNTAAPGN
jgi:hypothetical protein